MEPTLRPASFTPAIATLEPYGVREAGVTWSAVWAGAIGAAALSVIIAFLGFGLGMTAISPWSGVGATAAALGVASIAWITLTQIAASSLGGYLAGRLRVRWSAVHSDEVYFRDTTHGLLAWAIATLVVAGVFATTLGNLAKSGADLVGGTASTVVSAATTLDPDNDSSAVAYAVDGLFRTPAPSTLQDIGIAPPTAELSVQQRAEVTRILLRGMASDTVAEGDVRYLGQLIAQRSGTTVSEGEALVRRTHAELRRAVTDAKQAADTARKVSAYTALWLFIALLGGAFFAAWSATWGGRRRDLDV